MSRKVVDRRDVMKQAAGESDVVSCHGRAAPLESIEWVNVWVTAADIADLKLPRVLLIGDSITQSYFNSVENRLQGKACLARLSGSRCIGDPVLLKELDLILSQYSFQVIHFNNGLHGFGSTEADYARHFPEYLAAIRRGNPGASLIWGRSTPVRTAGKLEEYGTNNPRVIARNAIADKIIGEAGIPMTDLYRVLEGHPELYSNDGCHLNAEGVEALATVVAAEIEKRL